MAASNAVEERQDRRVLYITYDGLADPLGRSQILPYLVRLSERGHHITILSCEKPASMERDGELIRKICAKAGIQWHPLVYHKWPPVLSAVYDLARIRAAAVRLQRRDPFDLVHCRGHFSAIAGLHLKTRYGTGLLFDPRGFWPEEKAEVKAWNLRNPVYAAVYRYFKRLESRLLHRANQIVFLTQAGADVLLRRPELAGAAGRITVIPCCVDFDHFPLTRADDRNMARSKLGFAGDARVLLYLGSIGAWYLLDEMLDFFGIYQSRHPEARFLLVTPEEPGLILNAARDRGIDPDRLTILAASREEVPKLMSAADVGICFIRPLFSKTGSSPTKLGEMIAVGLPVIANAPVGDVETIVESIRCGVVVRELSPESYARAIDQLEAIQTSASDRRQAALQWFDLEVGAERYHRCYVSCQRIVG